MKNALLPRIMALATRALAAYDAMNDTSRLVQWDFTKFDKADAEMEAEMEAIDKEAGEGLAIGRCLRFGVADGHASYIITKIRKNDVVVEWIPLGDHYCSPAVGLSADKTQYIVLRSTAEHQCRWNETVSH